MKKILLITIPILAVFVLGMALMLFITRSTQKNFHADPPVDDCEVVMPLSGTPIFLEMAPGLKFKFDTGADMSSLSENDAETLREMGYEVKESFGPILGRDGYGDIVYSSRRYTVSLPVGGYVTEKDSTGNVTVTYTGQPATVFHNVDFAKTDATISTLGLDVLRKFKIECRFANHTAALCEKIPSSFSKVVEMEHNIHLTDILWSAVRPYLIVSVNQRPNVYQLDTGLQRAPVKKPASSIARAKHSLRKDSLSTMRETFEAYVDDEGWIDFGSRSGTKKVYYYDNNEDDFQINPLNVFQQDMIIDIEGKGIYFRHSI
ncbi:MAG: retroviral-like aspartic protease family protein [Paramuribaculum sp.]|nr:retroviral-like aspartic protease family protein [Paramuribaculum sp.]